MTFRIIATIATVVLVLVFTGDLAIAGAIGALDFVSKLAIYYLHERAWAKIKWGRRAARDH
ncbi:MAG: DUF2061 domain-containing protein [Candidatus Diapherotrites archaeon]